MKFVGNNYIHDRTMAISMLQLVGHVYICERTSFREQGRSIVFFGKHEIRVVSAFLGTRNFV